MKRTLAGISLALFVLLAVGHQAGAGSISARPIPSFCEASGAKLAAKTQTEVSVTAKCYMYWIGRFGDSTTPLKSINIVGSTSAAAAHAGVPIVKVSVTLKWGTKLLASCEKLEPLFASCYQNRTLIAPPPHLALLTCTISGSAKFVQEVVVNGACDQA